MSAAGALYAWVDAHWFATLLGFVVTLFTLDAVATRRGWYGRPCVRCARPTQSRDPQARHCRRCLEIV